MTSRLTEAAALARTDRVARHTVAAMLRGHGHPPGMERADLEQIARTAAWAAAQSYDGTRGASWRTWVILRVRHALLETFRDPAVSAPDRAGRVLRTVPLYGWVAPQGDASEPYEFADALPDPADAYAAADARHLLAMLQRRLSARQWEVLAGTVLADATYTEYAALIGRSLQRVQQRVTLAKSAAREVLGA